MNCALIILKKPSPELCMDEIYTKIVGVTFENEDGTHRQSNLEELDQQVYPIVVHLQWEPDNPYDPHAVAVFGPSGKQLGYLHRSLAYSISQMIEARYAIHAELTHLTGSEDLGHHYGANLLHKLWQFVSTQEYLYGFLSGHQRYLFYLLCEYRMLNA